VYEVDLLGELGEEHALLDGGVAAADDGDRLVPVQGAVAGGAPADAAADELGLAGDARPPRLHAGGEDHRAREDLLPVRGHDVVALGVAAKLGDALDLAHLGAELLGLLLHLLGEVEPRDALGEAGVVLHEVGEGDLPAGHVALEDGRLEAAAAAVDAGGQPGGAGADDDDVEHVGAGLAGGFRHEVTLRQRSGTRGSGHAGLYPVGLRAMRERRALPRSAPR